MIERYGIHSSYSSGFFFSFHDLFLSKDERKIGLVTLNLKEKSFDTKIHVEWLPDRKETTLHERADNGEAVLSLKESGIGGYYHPDSLSLFDAPPRKERLEPPFSKGDRVKVQDDVQHPKESNMKDSSKQGDTVENVKL